MARGLFITLEGVEGSGKTTQAATLAEALRKEGRVVSVTHEPGGTRAGEAIRKIFLDPEVSLDVASELLLVLADRAQHVREKLQPGVEAGEIVISDRYSDSEVREELFRRVWSSADASSISRSFPASVAGSFGPCRSSRAVFEQARCR